MPQPPPTHPPEFGPPTVYFAYGSNLSVQQMQHRCPSSPLHRPPLAILSGYRWVICPRGYANIIRLSGSTTGSEVDDGRTDGDGKVGDDLVYGLLYDLDPYDEANLDAMEGVPWAYEKHSVIASLVPSSPATTTASIVATTLDSAMAASSSTPVRSTIHTAEQIATMPKVTVLVYIDPEAGTGICIDEYMFRMNRGLRDALDLGMPKTWVRDVVGDFVPLHGDLAVIEK